MLSVIRNLAIVDTLICLLGVIITAQPFMWLPGQFIPDILVCFVWHSQMIYWALVFISVYSLVVLAYERFLAVCKPFSHQEFTHNKLYLFFLIMCFINILTSIAAVLQMRFFNGKCLSKFIMDTQGIYIYFDVYVIYGVTFYHLIPCTLFVYFYGKVLIAFRQRQKSPDRSVRARPNQVGLTMHRHR